MLQKINIFLREYINPILGPYRRRQLNEGLDNFTLLANDCWAGHVYRYFAMPYNSPTIGTVFFADDYIKFVSNLDKYLSMDLEMIAAHDSIHWESIKHQKQVFQECPYGRLGDIEVGFAHYTSPQEAYNKWCRRRDRMSWDNIIVKFSQHNECLEEHLRIFDKLPYDRKLVFVTRDYGLDSQVVYHEYDGQDDIRNNTAQFRKYVNLENLVNGLPFKKNQ